MLPDNILTKLSKFMSKILRHSPEEFGLALILWDSLVIADLIEVLRVQTKWSEIRVGDIEQVVACCEKQRFEIIGDRIRARYGHSHDKVNYPVAIPPNVLYHGTNVQAAPVILRGDAFRRGVNMSICPKDFILQLLLVNEEGN